MRLCIFINISICKCVPFCIYEFLTAVFISRYGNWVSQHDYIIFGIEFPN